MTTTETTKPSFKIQSNVALPTISRAPREQKYPFAELEIGDSFFIAGAKANTVHSATTRFIDLGNPTFKFTTRVTKEVVDGEEELGEQEGVRVWRIAVPAPKPAAAPAEPAAE
jgi:hypothetical protein